VPSVVHVLRDSAQNISQCTIQTILLTFSNRLASSSSIGGGLHSIDGRLFARLFGCVRGSAGPVFRFFSKGGVALTRESRSACTFSL